MRHCAAMPIVEAARERRTRSDRRNAAPPPIVADLRAAVERNEIEILFQPQFACRDGAVLGGEALTRWRHPLQGRIGGEALFAIAARAGIVERISRHVVREALKAAGDWPVPLRLSLNVTAADVAAGHFAQFIASAIAEAGFAPERLTLEITEQALVADLDCTAARLRQLAELGVRLALDDFGAGFCNFDYLKRLPLHYLKLDRSMIEGIDREARDLAVLRGILAMAQALGLRVVAEGIERESQRKAVVREGCESWQGYLGAEPLAPGEFAQLASGKAGLRPSTD